MKPTLAHVHVEGAQESNEQQPVNCQQCQHCTTQFTNACVARTRQPCGCNTETQTKTRKREQVDERLSRCNGKSEPKSQRSRQMLHASSPRRKSKKCPKREQHDIRQDSGTARAWGLMSTNGSTQGSKQHHERAPANHEGRRGPLTCATQPIQCASIRRPA